MSKLNTLIVRIKSLLHINSLEKGKIRDTMGNTFTPHNINTPMPLNTALPTGVNTWEDITPDMFHNWKNEMNISTTHTRFEVTPLSNGIVNKKKLVLEKVEKAF